MKKGLSILLIAAALFGFYGGAVNLNDVLACKDYWEKAGEESTANMNKLEDGLNQLKENEQAYLDGKDQVADGEKALADGEKALADGEATLADGEAQYAKGLADYKAAPAKLADARKQLAEGEQALKDGQDSIDGLTKLISGIKEIRSGYNDTWRPGYETLKKGRSDLAEGVNGSYKDLTDLAFFLDGEASQKGYLAAVKDVGKDDKKQTAKDYKGFIKSTNRMAKDLPTIQKNVKKRYEGAAALLKALKAQKINFEFAGAVSAQKKNLLSLAALIEKANGKKAAETYKATINAVADAYDNFDATVDAKYKEFMASEKGKQTEAYLISQNMDTGWAQFFGSDKGKQVLTMAKQAIAQKMGIPVENVPEEKAKELVKTDENFKAAQDGVAEAVKEKVDAAIKDNDDPDAPGVKQQVLAAYNDPTNKDAGAQLTAAKYGLTVDYNQEDDQKDGGVIGVVVSSLKSINNKVNGKNSKLKNKLLPGLKKFNKAATSKAIDKLSDGQNDIAGGVATVAGAVLGNSTLKAGVKKNFGNKALTLLKTYKSSSGPLSTSKSNFAKFEKQMDKTPGVENFLKKAQNLLAKTKADGLKTLADGKKKLADGKQQYAEGLKSYEEAPAKLADAERQLAEGRQKLEDGRQELADGRQALADGKAQLAQYEDGEQQVRDGLATLTGTEPDLDLQSIADRLNGDTDFDNGDDHLELDEGLAAVEIGRGYQAEDGVLITNEIMARAVGTGALLGAGVLAVLAAILSFLKKNKGAGVLAILSAAAGAFGAYYGSQAGTYFSSIAGSTVGATGWVAAGILGAVALVHAIAHFTAKKEA